MQGRPGISPLNLDTRYVLPDEEFDALRRSSEMLGLEEIKQRRKDLGVFPDINESEDIHAFLNVDPTGAMGSNVGDFLRIERGDEAKIVQKVDEDDASAILDQIVTADRQSDWVLASLHTHEGENGRSNHHSTPAFTEEFARDCIDAGADAFIAHGPHRIRGIEIYDDRPIFYSLGNFIKQNEFIDRYSAEVYDIHGFDQDALPKDLYTGEIFTNFDSDRADFESFLPICHFHEGTLDRIELIPFDMGYGEAGLESGYPEIVTGDTARRILNHLADLSKPYDTEISIEGDIGVIQT
jgi:poly-gamma-glutamate synthesis protein (capsule biosynthesis protein)